MAINILVNGLVSHRDKQPYVQILTEAGIICQLSMAETRQLAQDLLVMASRTEADAMLIMFFQQHDLPMEAAAAMLVEFRDFRAGLDDEKVDHTHRIDPDGTTDR
jgi:hypothetical protein